VIAIIDYGVGNLFSLKSSLGMIGADAVVTGDADEICRADKIILPGVGAFEDAANKLRSTGLDKVVIEQAQNGKVMMGICLGMQIKGDVIDMRPVIPAELKVPHIGWNGLHITKPEHPLFRYIHNGDCVYFVHSFYAAHCDDALLATAEYGKELTAAVADGNVIGCQFHPEKSGKVGLNILKAFCEL
jgi:glutamine amidotransferase